MKFLNPSHAYLTLFHIRFLVRLRSNPRPVLASDPNEKECHIYLVIVFVPIVSSSPPLAFWISPVLVLVRTLTSHTSKPTSFANKSSFQTNLSSYNILSEGVASHPMLLAISLAVPNGNTAKVNKSMLIPNSWKSCMMFMKVPSPPQHQIMTALSKLFRGLSM